MIKLARDRVREGETQIAELQREKVRRTHCLFLQSEADVRKARLGFASVVIDGDCMPVSYLAQLTGCEIHH